jgi:molecular chaperone DnaJ
MPRRNLYIVLGIPPDATRDMIRSAYRTLAKAHHPDLVGPGSAAQFREITEAYRVLSDPALRAGHNDALEIPLAEEHYRVDPTGRWHPGDAEPLSADPIVVRRNFHAGRPAVEDEFVDWTTGYFTDRHVPKSGQYRQVDLEVILTPEEAVVGGTLPIAVPAFTVCTACGGSGRDWFSFCLLCGGEGVREGRHTVRLAIPGMVRDGSLWEIPIPEGGLVLRVWIRIDPHSR